MYIYVYFTWCILVTSITAAIVQSHPESCTFLGLLLWFTLIYSVSLQQHVPWQSTRWYPLPYSTRASVKPYCGVHYVVVAVHPNLLPCWSIYCALNTPISIYWLIHWKSIIVTPWYCTIYQNTVYTGRTQCVREKIKTMQIGELDSGFWSCRITDTHVTRYPTNIFLKLCFKNVYQES